MKPAAKRRVERDIRKIMAADGDHCSLCRFSFPHNSRTFGGVTKVGTPALVGICCQPKLKEIILMGLYLDAARDDMVQQIPSTTTGGVATVSAEEAVQKLQSLFASRNSEIDSITRKAGVSGTSKVFRQESAWKADDAAWFAARPNRSHRLRKVIGDEAIVSGFSTEQMPPRHQLQVLVRQVQPGARVRMPFGRNLDTPIPDDETILHALYDVVNQEGGQGDVIRTEDVGRILRSFKNAEERKLS